MGSFSPYIATVLHFRYLITQLENCFVDYAFGGKNMADNLAGYIDLIRLTQNITPNVYIMHESNVVRTYATTLCKLYVDLIENFVGTTTLQIFRITEFKKRLSNHWNNQGYVIINQ